MYIRYIHTTEQEMCGFLDGHGGRRTLNIFIYGVFEFTYSVDVTLTDITHVVYTLYVVMKSES